MLSGTKKKQTTKQSPTFNVVNTAVPIKPLHGWGGSSSRFAGQFSCSLLLNLDQGTSVVYTRLAALWKLTGGVSRRNWKQGLILAVGYTVVEHCADFLS